MEKLELITKKIDVLLENNEELKNEVARLAEELEAAKNENEELTKKCEDLSENNEMKDLEMDDILSKLQSIVLKDANVNIDENSNTNNDTNG
jgi:cell division septum initiation protein DivIVA